MKSPSLDGRELAPHPNWALFLDIDGTLLDIAPRPEVVQARKGLAPALASASRWLGGALALTSGRSLAEIDQLMAPLRPPCLAEHGAIIRFADGATAVVGPDCAVPQRWRIELHAAVRGWPGVLVEDKAFGLAVHFRLAPDREADVLDLVEAAVAQAPAAFEVLPARMAFEIRHRGLSKAAAIERFMPRAPFAGRVPVFVGDDAGDEDGFRAARAMGGLALSVKDAFGGEPARVRRWLESFNSAPRR